jgi:hypothetical protein
LQHRIDILARHQRVTSSDIGGMSYLMVSLALKQSILLLSVSV